MNQKTSSEEQLELIRSMMEKSTRFVSISGLSAILAGCYALGGALAAYLLIFRHRLWWNEYFYPLYRSGSIDLRLQVMGIALAVLVLSLGTMLWLSARKARRMGVYLWGKQARRVSYHLALPLVAGGLFCLLLIWRNNISLVASACLVFYGLALFNASKFTFNEVHYLGVSQIVLGLVSGFFLNHGLLFWAIGFGVFHIVFGVVIHWRYDRQLGKA